MKILKNTLIFLMIITGFTACEKDEPEVYFSVLGMLEKTDENIFIDSDDGKKILINNEIKSYLEDGDRIVAIFTKVEEELPAGVELIVNIIDIDTVLFKNIIELTPENSDSLGNDPVRIDDLWIAKDFMNINFSFVGGNTSHLINLALVNDSTDSDTVSLELRHNDNDDTGIYNLGSFVSYDLTKVKSEAADSVILKITAQDFYNKDFEDYITYKY